MSGIVLGIDLGTTNSVIAVSDGGQSRVIPAPPDGRRLWPSVVAFPPSGDVLVGPSARERRLIDAANTIYSVKRLIGLPYESPEVERAKKRLPFALAPGDGGRCVVRARGKEYSLPEISAFVLRDLRRIAEHFLGEKCERAVVTVPANFNELQRSATKAAGMIAGIDVIRILNEPTAAALAYGYANRKPERLVVYDLGGGTFDVSILELEADAFEVVATAGDSFLGGDDVDVAIAEGMADAFLQEHRIDPRTNVQQFERLRAAAEWVKCKLSLEPEATARVEELATGERGVPLHLDYAMSRADLEARAKPIVERSLAVCKQALESAGMRPRDIQSVILVGGATRMPLVRKMVRDFFRRQPRTDIDPDLVVAIGAGILGHQLSGRPDVGPAGRAPSRPQLVRPDLARLLPHEPEKPIPAQPAFAPGESQMGPLPTKKRPPRPTPPPPGLPVLPEPMPERPQTIEPPGLIGFLDGKAAPSKPNQPAGSNLEPDPSFVPGELDLDAELAAARLATPAPVAEPPPPEEDDLAIFFPSDPAPAPPPAPPAKGRLPAVLAFDDEEEPIDVSTEMLVTEPEPVVPSVELPPVPPPLLMDVTPHSLGIEMAGGICSHLIRRNVPMPAEQVRVFTTARDDQESVVVRVCQGESRVFKENQLLGEIELTGLRRAPRGAPKIQVAFIIDASGTLECTAVDHDTKRAQTIRINLLGGYDASELDALRKKHEAAFAMEARR